MRCPRGGQGDLSQNSTDRSMPFTQDHRGRRQWTNVRQHADMVGLGSLSKEAKATCKQGAGDGAPPGGVGTRAWAPGDESGETLLGKELAGGDSEDG